MENRFTSGENPLLEILCMYVTVLHNFIHWNYSFDEYRDD